LAAKIGAICPLAHKKTPYTERYFLGGDTLMRGFEDREISPKEMKRISKNDIEMLQEIPSFLNDQNKQLSAKPTDVEKRAFDIANMIRKKDDTAIQNAKKALGGNVEETLKTDSDESQELKKMIGKDSKDNVGGNSFVYLGAEYTFNIFDDFYGAAFVEAGNVGIHQNVFHQGLNVDAGFGLRIFIGGMPLHLDWGYPVHCSKDIKKKGVQFNFSFGASF
jgi:outer membrane protein assembly factor BamA